MKITDAADRLGPFISLAISPTRFVAGYADPDIDAEPQASLLAFVLSGDVDYSTGALIGPADLFRVTPDSHVTETAPHDQSLDALAQQILDKYHPPFRTKEAPHDQ